LGIIRGKGRIVFGNLLESSVKLKDGDIELMATSKEDGFGFGFPLYLETYFS
jgi:hypothetical protein